MFALTNARGETVDINNDKLLSYTPTGLGVQFTNTYSQYETYFKATKSTVAQGQFQIYILFGDVESQAYQTFSDFAQFLAYQPLTLTYTTDSGTWYRDGRLNSLTKTEIGGSTVFATDRINESFTLEFINNWYNNKSAEYKSYDPDPNLGTYGKIYRPKYDPMVNRNLILGTETDITWTADSTNNYSFNVIATGLKPNQTYTFSAEVTLGNADQKNTTLSLYDAPIGQWLASTDYFKADGARDHWTFTVPSTVDSPTASLLIYAGNPGSTSGKSATYHHTKLETGNVPTDWTPAPEDNLAIPLGYAYAPFYVYIEANRNTNEKSVSLVNKSRYFGLQKGSPCIITIGGSSTDTLSPSWSVIQNGNIVATDGVLVALSKNQKLVVSSYPEDQYARVYNPDGSYADVSQLQDFTKTNFVQIPEGESTVLFYVDNQATVNLTFKEERLLV